LIQREHTPSQSAQDEFDIAASIVTFHTDSDELVRLVTSLQKTPLRVGVTVVDNSPTDILRAPAVQAGATYVHTGSNLGYGRAHNLALRRTLNLAPYQVVVNPDIVLNQDTLQHLYDFMQQNPGVGQVMPSILNPDGSEQRLTKRLPLPTDLFLRRFLGGFARKLASQRSARYEMRDIDLSRPHDVPCLSGCFMFLRSSVLKEIGLFDERFFMYMEDVDLCRRIGSRSRTVYFPDTFLFHGYTKGSYKNLNLALAHLQSALKYFSKWGWIFDRERTRRNSQV